MRNPRVLADDLEKKGGFTRVSWERFRGYGVVGLPFSSGHVLAFRRMTASSIGPPYTSVWHRDPSEVWTMFVDGAAERTCPRFFGRVLDRVVVGEIEVRWEGPMRLSITVPDARLQWGMRLTCDGLMRAMSWTGRTAPAWALENRFVLSTMGRIGGRLLGVGRMSFSGRAPNGQKYVMAPRSVFRINAAAAVLEGRDLGEMGALAEQPRLGDFWIPNGGFLAFGGAGFETLDPTRHSQATTRWARADLVRPEPTRLPRADETTGILKNAHNKEGDESLRRIS